MRISALLLLAGLVIPTATLAADCILADSAWELDVKKVKVQINTKQAVNCFKKTADWNGKYGVYNSPLTAAIVSGRFSNKEAAKAVEIIDLLLTAGADVNYAHSGQANDNFSPLFVEL